MNKSSFILGIIAGALLAVIVNFAMNYNNSYVNSLPSINGLAMLNEREPRASFDDVKSIKIDQAIAPKAGHTIIGSKRLLYVTSDDVHLYDGQKIEIPQGKALVQIGTYQYTTVEKEIKTIPAVTIK